MAAVLPQTTVTPVGGTSTYFDTDAIVGGSAPKIANSVDFFNTTVAANHKEGAEELALLKCIYARSDLETIRGNPNAVCNAIDDFAATIPRGLMTIGAEKRAFITDLLVNTETAPTLFLEFGSYVGYSAICLASAMVARASPGQSVRYVSFEKNPIIAAVASSLVDLAGLRDVITIHIGSAAGSLMRLAQGGTVTKGTVDFMLLDHWKDFYISDLQLCEKLSLIRPGSVVLADNIIFPGAPEYLAYVQAGNAKESPDDLRYTTKTADFVLPFGGPDQLAISTVF
ncbi:S-adenosyl-L-methionine-dependent methyltransferase [Boeremia exigua]|uniref:S-adenosyl-L-methionine-dependent methyltransferase n=1 Tax=Boeremia exigua TaxID=749465 RepID=UPI001E8DEC98|nr:S-adenosyl-L-methionine-dependent methyltransferase [Boeremia exigua]KAH6639124.1 S-adenosyl-L-methionine-dependent methyltransferase [Boeremia exigua]